MFKLTWCWRWRVTSGNKPTRRRRLFPKVRRSNKRSFRSLRAATGEAGSSATSAPYQMHEVTQILEAVSRGEANAANELLLLVYQELRRLAAKKMASEAHGHTLQATALVHEAWLRLTNDENRK